MFRFERSQHRHSATYFSSHLDFLDPGVAIAATDSLDEVAALRSILNACKSIVAKKAPILFEYAEVSKIRKGWQEIDEEVFQKLNAQSLENPRASEHEAWSSVANLLNRGRQLFELAWNQSLHVVHLDEVLGQRVVRGLGRSFSKIAFGIGHAEVVSQTRHLCAQFGLTAIRVTGENQMSPRERSRGLQRTANDLAKACKTMGIVQADFGGGCVVLCVDPHLPKLMNGSGSQRHLGTAGIEIGFSPNQPGVCSTLIHEYVHRLDNSLGLKALDIFNDAHGIQGPPCYDDRTMFSNLSPEKQALLPLAKEGVEKVFSTLGTTKAGHVDMDRLFDSAAYLLGAKTLGVPAMVQASALHLQAWIEAVRVDDDALFKGLAERVTSLPVNVLANHYFEDYQDAQGREHPFYAMAQSQGVSKENLNGAFAKIHSTVEKLAVWLHPALPAGMSPSSFLTASVRESVQKASGSTWRVRDVISMPHEVLARLVGRPDSIKNMAMAFLSPSRASPLGSEALNNINEGFMKMAQADGVRATAQGAKLSSGGEIVVALTATPVFKVVQRAKRALLFLSGQTVSAPRRSLQNDAQT